MISLITTFILFIRCNNLYIEIHTPDTQRHIFNDWGCITFLSITKRSNETIIKLRTTYSKASLIQDTLVLIITTEPAGTIANPGIGVPVIEPLLSHWYGT